jgi:hypothetical protein
VCFAVQDGAWPVESCFEMVLQATHGAAKAGNLSCALLFAHCADELGLRGRLIWVQGLTRSRDKDAWSDPAAEAGLPSDPHPLPCEAPPVQVLRWACVCCDLACSRVSCGSAAPAMHAGALPMLTCPACMVGAWKG